MMKKFLIMFILSMTMLSAQNGSGMQVNVLNPKDASPRLSIKINLDASILNGLHLKLPSGLQPGLESASINNVSLWTKKGAGPITKKQNLGWTSVKDGLNIHYFDAQVGDVLLLVIRPDGRHLKRVRNLNVKIYPLGTPITSATNTISTIQIPLNYIKMKK